MGPCTANARRLTEDSRCCGTTISCCVADLRRCLPTTSVTGVQQSTRYCGALPCRHLYMMTPSLYVTQSATSIQCRSSCKIWVLWVCVNWCHTNPWHLWATACVVFLLLILPNWMFTSPNLQIQGLCHFCRLACHFTVCTLSRCNILLTVVGRCRYNTSLIRLRAEKIDEEDSSTSDERTAEDSEKMF